MYARVLVVAQAPLGEASFTLRLCEVMRAQGHAVHECFHLQEDGDAPRELAASCAAFRPSLVLWDVCSAGEPDVACRAALKDLACCVALMRRGLTVSLELLEGERVELGVVGADRSYACAVTSDIRQGRHGVACFQERTAEREQAMRDVPSREGMPATELMAFDPSWPWPFHRAHPQGNPAYYLRTCRCATYFAETGDGARALCLSDVALRVAEGCLVLAERGALPGAREAGTRDEDDAGLEATGHTTQVEMSSPSEESSGVNNLPESLIPFDRDELPMLLGRYLADDRLGDDAREAQARAFAGAHPLDEAVPDLLVRLDDMERGAGRPGILTMDAPALNVVVFGWLGAGNFGDDLLVRVAMDRLTRLCPQAVVRIVGADARKARLAYGCESYVACPSSELGRVMAQADCLVYLGGLVADESTTGSAGPCEFMAAPTFDLAFQADLALLARLYGVPIVGLGIGGGPIGQPAAQAATYLLGVAGMRFLARDENTAALVREVGVPKEQVAVRADLVLGAADYVRAHAGASLPAGLEAGTYFMVSLRSWPACPPDFAERMAAAVEALMARTGLRAAFVPFGTEDAAMHSLVVGLLRERDRGEGVVEVGERLDEAVLLALVAGSRLALGMRLHCSILHHVLGKPVLGVDYNDKVRVHFERMGQLDVLVPLDVDAARLNEAIGCLLERPEDRVDLIAKRVSAAERLVGNAYEELCVLAEARRDERLARNRETAGEPLTMYPRLVGAPEQGRLWERARADDLAHEIDVAREDLARARAEADAARQELAAVRSSWSFRVGNAVLRPLSALRRIVSRSHGA